VFEAAGFDFDNLQQEAELEQQAAGKRV